MTKPDFSIHSSEPMSEEDRHLWFRESVRKVKELGATWIRGAVDDVDNPSAFLVEGWVERPEDQPPPSFPKK